MPRPPSEGRDPFDMQLESIRQAIADPGDSDLGSNNAIFRRAYQFLDQVYTNDEVNTYRVNLEKNFPKREGRGMPKSLQEWKAYFESVDAFG